MARIRSRDTGPELLVRRSLHAKGFRFRLHRRDLPGTPDIVLQKYGAVVEVRGCFWHRHRGCRLCTFPKSNEDFWNAKLEGNVARDRTNENALMRAGWRLAIVWQCASESDPNGTMRRLIEWLQSGRRKIELRALLQVKRVAGTKRSSSGVKLSATCRLRATPNSAPR